jgi:4-amino-4-deoxy-L-arabinose transferase-like glycosyltransferase
VGLESLRASCINVPVDVQKTQAMAGTGLIGALERRPLTAFGGFLVLHALVWTALPSLLYKNLPLDVIEAMTYGREWQAGYDKLPPLPWFLAEIAYRMFGTDDALYALSQVAVVVAFALMWLTARPLIGVTGSFAAILIIDGMNYFNTSATKFNHNVAELPFWALAGFAFFAALRRGQLRFWILLGLALGLAWWAKYFMVILAAPLALFLLFDPDARRRLAGPGPWIAAAVTLVVAAPNLLWIFQHSDEAFGYVETRAHVAASLLDRLLNPLEFLAAQAVYVIPALLIALPLFLPRARFALRTAIDPFDHRVILLLAFGPALALFVFSAISGRTTQAMWGFPLWVFLGLQICLLVPEPVLRARFAALSAVWAVVSLIYVSAFIADYTVLPNIDHRYRAAFFPGDALSAEITARFRAATGREPAYVIASMWDGGNVAHYSKDHPQPRVLIDGSPRRAPWIDLADLQAKGAVLVWTDGDPRVMPEALAVVAPGVKPGAPFELPYHRGDGTVHVGWAVLPPRAP